MPYIQIYYNYNLISDQRSFNYKLHSLNLPHLTVKYCFQPINDGWLAFNEQTH